MIGSWRDPLQSIDARNGGFPDHSGACAFRPRYTRLVMPLQTGELLGPYEILAPLGAGGMGEVYKARDTRLNRTVAIKVLPPEVSGAERRRQRLLQEARAASALNHPNIVTVYDIVSEATRDSIVMEYIEGRALAEMIRGT